MDHGCIQLNQAKNRVFGKGKSGQFCGYTRKSYAYIMLKHRVVRCACPLILEGTHP